MDMEQHSRMKGSQYSAEPTLTFVRKVPMMTEGPFLGFFLGLEHRLDLFAKLYIIFIMDDHFMAFLDHYDLTSM